MSRGGAGNAKPGRHDLFGMYVCIYDDIDEVTYVRIHGRMGVLIFLSTYLSIYLSMHLSIFLSMHLSIYLSISLPSFLCSNLCSYLWVMPSHSFTIAL